MSILRLRSLALFLGLTLLSGLAAAAPAPSSAPAAPARDLTFFVVSDLHYNSPVKGDFTLQRSAIAAMNALPGAPWPGDPESKVAPPRGVIVPGDLEDNTRDNLLHLFEEDFGLCGEKRFHYPVFEGLGNHDSDAAFPWAMMKRRNAARPGVDAVSTNGYHYSWTWDGIHFVMLNDCAADAVDPLVQNKVNPRQALSFLKRDLRERVGASGRPVILVQHFDLQKPGQFWSQAQFDALAAAIRDYNVIAIIHGHSHDAETYRWQGIDVLSDGAVRFGKSDMRKPAFFVFRIRGNHLAARQRLVSGEWGNVTLELDFPETKKKAAAPVGSMK